MGGYLEALYREEDIAGEPAAWLQVLAEGAGNRYRLRVYQPDPSNPTRGTLTEWRNASNPYEPGNNPTGTWDGVLMPTLQLSAAPVMLAAVAVEARAVTAQAVEAPQAPDPGEWFASTAVLAVVIAAIVAFMKAHVLKSLGGLGTVLASVAVGVLLGFHEHTSGYLADGLVAALGFGGSAGLLASGGWDALKGILGKRSAGA